MFLKIWALEEVEQTQQLHKINQEPTIFLLINAPGAMQNIDREPLFCTQFAKQKVCPIVYIIVFLEMFNPFQNKPWFLRVCSTNLLKTKSEKEKLLVMSNFSFLPYYFLPFSSNMKLSSANSFSFDGSKICRLGKGLDEIIIKSEEIFIKFFKYCYF